MLTHIEPNSVVFHPSFGVGVIERIARENGNVHIKFGRESKLIFAGQAPGILRAATEEEKSSLNALNFIRNHEHSEKVVTYLHLLREGGDKGVLNVCGCPKNEWMNYTCPCKTLEKVYHRFSVFKNQLNKVGFVIDDVETESGHHKTILRHEP